MIDKKFHECCRVILGVKRADRISNISLINAFGFMSIECLFKLQKLLFIYKAIHSLLPVYSNKVFYKTKVATRSHSSSFFIPRMHTTSGRRAFTYWGPQLWSTLDSHLKLLSLPQFKMAIIDRLNTS